MTIIDTFKNSDCITNAIFKKVIKDYTELVSLKHIVAVLSLQSFFLCVCARKLGFIREHLQL